MAEREKTGPLNPEEPNNGPEKTFDYTHLSPKPVSQKSIDDIVSHVVRHLGEAGPVSFEELYVRYDNYHNPEIPGKFDIVYALIKDGRYKFDSQSSSYKDLDFLVENFILPGDKNKPIPQILQDKLRLLMVEKGFVKEHSRQERKAKDAFARMVLSDEDLEQLSQTLPIGFMGALARIKFYQDAPKEERERLRSFTTRAMLRPYIGNFKYRRPVADLDFSSMIRLLPEQVFDNESNITMNLARHYLDNEALKLFIDGESVGFSKLRDTIEKEQSEVKKNILEGIMQEFTEVSQETIPDDFKEKITDESDGNEYDFPAFRQKYFLYHFKKRPQMFLCGRTGATKTACAFLGMESLNRKKVTIFGEAQARLTWPEQAAKHFKEGSVHDVFAVMSREDLDNPRIDSANYVYISSALLADAMYSPDTIDTSLPEAEQARLMALQTENRRKADELYSKLMEKVAVARQTDAVITEEAQVFRNPKAQCTQVVADLIGKIREKYHPTVDAPELPFLAVTGSPIYSDIDDLDVNMALLYPNQFAMPGQETGNRYTFSSSCDFNPEVAFIKLYGEKLLMRWATEDLFGDKVPVIGFDDIERVSMDMPPELSVVYNWMLNLEKVSEINKIWLLRSILINPHVVRELNKKHRWYQSSLPVSELEEQFLNFHEMWQQWSIKRNSNLEPEPFSADFIAMQDGGPRFLIEVFCHDELMQGLESLAINHPEIKTYFPQTPSPKAEYIRRLLQDRFHKEGENYKTNAKVVVVSNEQTLGITRYLDDPDTDRTLNAFSLYELALLQMLPGITREQAINIDSSVDIKKRREIAKAFREDPEKYLLLVLNRDSMEVSIDMAPRDSLEGIDEVIVNFLGMTYSFTPISQHTGRYVRPGVSRPVHFTVSEVKDSIDIGLYESSKRSYLVNEITLAGIPPDPEDADFLDKTKIPRKIIRMAKGEEEDESYQSVDHLIRDMLMKLRGIGEDKMMEALDEKDNQEKSAAEIWAELYIDQGNDIFKVVGNNAELVAHTLMQDKLQSVLSVGAGSCLLDRKLKEKGFNGEITNIDINGAILRKAKEMYPQIGEIEPAVASHLPFVGESFDAVDCSFMLDMNKFFEDPGLGTMLPTHQIERVRILKEINRVLKIGGNAVITLPQHSMDNEIFSNFSAALENFGFKVVGQTNGQVVSTDTEPRHEIGWIITLEKVSGVNPTEFDPMGLMLLTDDIYRISRYRGDKKGQIGQIEVNNLLFDAREFEVKNPDNNETISTGEPVKVEMDEETEKAWEKLSLEFLTGIMNPFENITKIRPMIEDISERLNNYQRRWWNRSWKLVKDHLIRYDYYSLGTGLRDAQETELWAKLIAGKILFDNRLYTYENLRYHNIFRKYVRNTAQEYLRGTMGGGGLQ